MMWEPKGRKILGTAMSEQRGWCDLTLMWMEDVNPDVEMKTADIES